MSQNQFSNYAATLRYLRPRQIFYRFLYETKKRLRHKIVQKNDGTSDPCANFPLWDRLHKPLVKKDVLRIADNTCANRFCFLNNLSHHFRGGVDFCANPFDYRLWQFQLNSFDWLSTLTEAFTLTGKLVYIQKAISLIESWCENHLTRYHRTLWDAYCTSERVISWIWFYAWCSKHRMYTEKLPALATAIELHGSFLYRNIEYHLGANHLLMDAKALIITGLFLQNEKYTQNGISLLNREIDEQFMSDGGHYERTPSYHIETLNHCLELIEVLSGCNKDEEAAKLEVRTHPLRQYLANIRTPEDSIPLLNDSTEDRYFYSSSTEESLLPVDGGTGLAVLRSNPFTLYFDCGDGGPDYNLGHTHADSLSVLLYHESSPIFVDSGTYTYKESLDRDYFRSTKAHNTVCIDNTSSSTVWKAFRTGKRAKTKILSKTPFGETDRYFLITAEHDGYFKVLPGDDLTHSRTVFFSLTHPIILIADKIYGTGNNPHTARLSYYLHTDIKPIKNPNLSLSLGDYIHMRCGGVDGRDISLKVANAMISRRFSEKLPTKCVYADFPFTEEISFWTVIAENDLDYTVTHNNGVLILKLDGSEYKVL